MLSLGDRVEDGTYRVHSRFRRAVNLTDGRRIVSVVSHDVDAGPINVVVSRLDPVSVSGLEVDGRSLSMGGASLLADDVAVYRSSLSFDPRDLPALERNLGVLRRLLTERAPERSLAFLLDGARLARLGPGFERALARHVGTCVRDIFYGDIARGVARLSGCGFGLTPAGDDFLAGLLTALRVLELATGRDLASARADVSASARTGNALSMTFLELAAQGLVFESTRDLLTALSRGGARDVRAAVDRVVSVGATSGADAAVGLCMTLRAGLAGWPDDLARPLAGAGAAGRPHGGEDVACS
ncbi:MAG: DUF2877 domain-containing protein [Candidatus Eisenbacteria bacterium]